MAQTGLDAATVEEITRLVVASSSEALRWFRRPMDVENKAAGSRGGSGNDPVHRWDPVTEADRLVEEQLRRGLRDRFPSDRIVGEEGGSTGEGPDGWLIDPIDGTRAFVTGQPLWGTLLGRLVGDHPVAGWLHQPTLGHTYIAAGETNELRTPEGTIPLATSPTTELDEAVLLCTSPTMFHAGFEHAAFEALSAKCRLTRYSGDCLNYGYLATGFADLVVENQLEAYDIVPLVPIVEAAGGVISGLDGEPPSRGWAIAAATAELHASALELLRSGLKNGS